MSVLNQLPIVYRLAILQGARVEAYLKNEKKWFPILQLTGITYNTPYRVHEKDSNIFEKVKASIPDFFTIVKYHDYDYLVPKNALESGNIMIMEYGLGSYVQVQDDLSLKDLSYEEGKKLAENSFPYRSVSHDSFYGIDEEHSFNEKSLADE